MINLFINYYKDNNHKRQAEIDYAIIRNLQNLLISQIYVIVEKGEHNKQLLTHPKVFIIYSSYRPTYHYFITLINKYSKNKISIIANTDIYFDDTLRLLKIDGYNKKIYALTRWDITKQGVKFYNRADSQDCWIFFSNGIVLDDRYKIMLGYCGCDNKIAYLFDKNGYYVTNPSFSIRAYHVHMTEKRNKTGRDNPIPPPYKFLTPMNL